VWILKRFLYKPVLDIIARRRAGIESQLAEAGRLHEEADSLKADYENRLADWDHERRQLRDSLAQELDAERARQMEAVQAALAEEREKARVAEARQRAEAGRRTEHQALQQGAQFATRLLARAAGPQLEERLSDLLLDELSTLSSERIAALATQWGEPPAAIRVASAFALPADRRQRLEKALHRVTGVDVPVEYEQDPALLAGLHITIGAWVLHTDVRDELKGFAELTHATR